MTLEDHIRESVRHFRNRKLPLETRLRILNSYILSVLTYCSETWTTSTLQETRLVWKQPKCGSCNGCCAYLAQIMRPTSTFSTKRHLLKTESAFQLINGGRCSSDSLQHDRRSSFPGCCCPCMEQPTVCLLYTSPSPRDRTRSRMPSSA